MTARTTRTLGVLAASAAVAAIGSAAPSSAAVTSIDSPTPSSVQFADCDGGEPNGSWCMDSTRKPEDGDAGGVSLRTITWKPNTGHQVTEAHFHAKGERITIYDDYPNGRPAVARLWVAGSGPAVFYGEEGKRITHNQSYDEGQSVRLQVCTSDSPKAKCTDPKAVTGRT